MKTNSSTRSRLQLLHFIIIAICAVFIIRLFYLQVFRFSYYQEQAQASQLKRYEIPAERGLIYAYDGEDIVPLVLNESRYRIVADPTVITDKQVVLDADKIELEELLNTESRYVILDTKQPKEIKEKVEQLMFDGDITGVFAEKTPQRVYPLDSTAAQLLGYVDDEGLGQYGVEQALEESLGGVPGRVAALTDQNGIPLLATGENVVEEPVEGEDIVLTIDVAMQQQLEQILVDGLERAISESGSALIIEANTGQVKAIANYPSYDPAEFFNVEDPQLFTNPSVSSTLEPGSVIKTLSVAAGLDSGSISPNQTYYDPGFITVDGETITNIVEVGGAATRSIEDILRFSLNTGAAYVLQQMGGGEINQQARETWHFYMTEKYGFGAQTGIEQGFEERGNIPDPNDGFGLNIQYANSAFGQGMTVTPIQLGAAIASIVNGGKYYQPTLVAATTDENGDFIAKDPILVRDSVIKASVSDTIRNFMETTVQFSSAGGSREGYRIGGKTGSAQIARPEGGYYEDRFNGTYVGYVGGETPKYVIVVRVNDPKIDGYSGSRAAGPIFVDTVNMLIDNFSVPSLP
jgi:cell division protein FtsI/penicillin-binding protein 2